MYHSVCKTFREECKKLPGLNSGWIAATKKFIVLFNEGKVTLRSRGKKKEELCSTLLETHKEAVKLQRFVSQQHEDKLKVMTVERYKETHSQRTPGQDGLSTARVFKDDKWQDSVALKMQAEGEWTLRITQGDSVIKKSEVADGETAVRSGQLSDVFGGQAHDLTNAFRTMKKGEALKGPEHQSKARSSSSSSASSHSDDAASNSEEGQSDFGDSDSNNDTGKAVQIKGKGNAPAEPAPPVKAKKTAPHHKKNKPSSDKSPAKTSAISEAPLTLLVHR